MKIRLRKIATVPFLALMIGVGMVGPVAAGAATTSHHHGHHLLQVDFDARVTAIGTGSFTVLRGTSVITVDVSGQTTYSEHGVTTASFANLAVGERVHVDGTKTASVGVVDAQHVAIRPLVP
jgi:hypothetical protein